MKKFLCSLLFLALCIPGFSQEGENEDEVPQDGWVNKGNFSLMFNQAAFNNNWQGGGTSSIAGDAALEYGIGYRQGRFTWDNTFIGEYGLTKQKGEHFMRKTSDKLEINSVAGYKVAEESHWSYSFFVNFKTQWDKGFEYDTDNNTRSEITRFMSPGYLKFGPGMLYDRGEILQVNIAPATSRFVFVSSVFTDPTSSLYHPNGGDSYYGVSDNKTMEYEFGASLDANSKIDLFKNVVLNQRVSLFTNYLKDFGNIDLDYVFKLDMKINDFLSANVLFEAIYENNAVSAFQIREMIGVGFSHRL